MDIKTFLENCVSKALETFPDLFLVGTEVNETYSKFVFIVDGDKGFTIQQCGKISRSVLNMIAENPDAEAERENFSFEVASPGVEKPMILARQYPKHVGREVEVLLQDETKILGKLTAVTPKEIEVLQVIKSKVKGRRDKEGEKMNIPFDQIKESKIKLSFK